MNTRSINKVIMVVGLLGVISTTYAVEETWTRKADMPTARFGLSTSVVDGKIYAIGGGKTPHGAYLSTVEEYDPATDTWTRKADMPTARNGHAAAVVNGKIYVIGGEPSATASIPTVEEYNPATDTWTRKADMPTERTFLCACAVDGKIYAIGGIRAGDPGTDPFPPTIEEYDPLTDTWTKKADMPTQTTAPAASVVDGKIYVIGGVTGDVHGPSISTVQEYDPSTDTWTRKADMPTARQFLSTCVLDGKVYAIGGADYPSWTVFSSVEEYDPTTDIWTTKPDMPTARDMLSTSVVNGKIYAIGGTAILWPWTGRSTVEEYDPNPIIVDFNGDGFVNIKDLMRVIESWGQDNPLCDIAPAPFGDGIVDALDLELLMSSWEQSIDDPTLITHWALDEVEGDTAYDSAGINNAVVIGNPTWLPSDGQVQGALQLDGIDDCFIANSVLNPASGPFSVFAWIKGNVPGQVIISGPMSANWLCTDVLTGNLMTELKGAGRSGKPLQSQILITDGNWHRIGLVWDGSNRMLYIDDLLAAEDTQNGLESSDNGLYIGCGKNMEPGTYFSGLIDDVRIYNRAVRP